MWSSDAQIYSSVTRYKKRRKISLTDFITCIVLALISRISIGFMLTIYLVETQWKRYNKGYYIMKIFGILILFKRKKKVVLCPECKGTGRDKYNINKECSYCCYGIKS